MCTILYGAIFGDLCGQPYEFKYKGDFSEFDFHDPKSKITDDTYMTLAVASKLLGRFSTYEEAFKDMGNRYPGDNYGKGFSEWLSTPMGTIGNSYGNGSIMRASPIMYLNRLNKFYRFSENIIINELFEQCQPSHDHIHSYDGLLRLRKLYLRSNTSLQNVIFRYGKYAPFKKFEVNTIKTISFIEKASVRFTSTKEAIKDVVSKRGDTDTNASIIGELMNYRYRDLSQEDIEYIESKLDDYLLGILKDFNERIKNEF